LHATRSLTDCARQISALGAIAAHSQTALLGAPEPLLAPLQLAGRILPVPRLETLLLDAQQMMRDAPLLRLQVLRRRLALRARGARAGRRARGPGGAVGRPLRAGGLLQAADAAARHDQIDPAAQE